MAPHGHIYGSRFPFCRVNCKLLYLPLQSSSIPHNKRKPVLHRWVVTELAHRAKEGNWNYFWKVLQLQPDPGKDASHGTITAGGMQLHCSHKQSCKSEMFEQGQMSDFPCFTTLRQPFPRGRRLRASPTSWCSNAGCSNRKLAKIQITWPHPSSDAEGEHSGCPWEIFFINLDFQARLAGEFIDTLISFYFYYLFIFSFKNLSSSS